MIAGFHRFHSVYNLTLLLVNFCLWFVVVEVATARTAFNVTFMRNNSSFDFQCCGNRPLNPDTRGPRLTTLICSKGGLTQISV